MKIVNIAETTLLSAIAFMCAFNADAIIITPDSTCAPKVSNYNDKGTYVDAFTECALKSMSSKERAAAQQQAGGLSVTKHKFKTAASARWTEYAKSTEAVKGATQSEHGNKTGNKLDAIFGVSLGKPIDVDSIKRPLVVRFFKPFLEPDPNIVTFVPRKQFRKYSTYRLEITPETHTVYRIIATNLNLHDPKHPTVSIDESRKMEYEHVKRALEQKFGKAWVTGQGDCPAYEFPFFDETGEKVVRKIKVSKCCTQIVARDFAAESLLAQEKELIKQRKQANESVTAEDVEAL